MTSLGPIVVKIGGSTLGTKDSSLADVARLAADGCHPIVVHGGGAAVTDWMDRLGIRAEFAGGLRVTDGPSLDVVTAVLAVLVNTGLVQQLAAYGARAIGISGADCGLLSGRVDDLALGFVASTVTVDPQLIRDLVDAGYVPVIAPLAIDESEGRHLLNVNADTAAGAIAATMGVADLVFLTDVDGVLDANGRLLRRVPGGQVQEMIDRGVVKAGMIPKVRACMAAAEAGVRAQIINGTQASALAFCLDGNSQGTTVV